MWDAALAEGASSWVMPRLIVEEQAGLGVGAVGFKAAPERGTGEIGYNVAPTQGGRGYATEGVRLICAQAALSGEFVEITAQTLVSHVASQRVLVKAGFCECGARVGREGPLRLWRLELPRDGRFEKRAGR